jgi:hypothetical protein
MPAIVDKTSLVPGTRGGAGHGTNDVLFETLRQMHNDIGSRYLILRLVVIPAVLTEYMKVGAKAGRLLLRLLH